MADHPRLTVLKVLTVHLEGIATADGFAHNLAGAVFRGRTEFGDNDPVPMISILEAPKPDAAAIFGGGGAARHEQWDILIQGWARDDALNPTDPLYPLLNDVESRLSEILLDTSDSYMLKDDAGNWRISGITVLPPVVRPPSTTPAAKACFFLPLRLGLALGVG